MNIAEVSLLILGGLLLLLFLIRLSFVPLALVHEITYGRRRRAAIESGREFRPFASIVVPAYNEERVLENCVTSIVEADYPDYEVIIVDDGSSDGTAAVARRLAERYPHVTAISQTNGGKGSALNTGFAAARGEFLLFVDADGIFQPTTIPEMLRPFEDERVGAVCGDDATMNLDRIQTRFLALVSHVGTGLVRRALHMLRCVPVVSGNSGAFRRSALQSVSFPDGPLRTDTIGEDLELTWRLHRARWQVAYAPHARVLAESPSTLLSLWKQRTRWARGLLQSLHLHDDAVGSDDYGTFGAFLIYTIVSMVALPIIQAITLVAAVVWLVWALITGEPIVLDVPEIVWAFVWGFLAYSVAVLVFSILLDRRPGDLRHMWAVVLWPFFSAFLGMTMVRAAWLEMRKSPNAWNKLERTGVNSYAGSGSTTDAAPDAAPTLPAPQAPEGRPAPAPLRAAAVAQAPSARTPVLPDPAPSAETPTLPDNDLAVLESMFGARA